MGKNVVVLPVSTGRRYGLKEFDVRLPYNEFGPDAGPTVAQEQEFTADAETPLWIPGGHLLSNARREELIEASDEAQRVREKQWAIEDHADVEPASPEQVRDWIENDLKPRIEHHYKQLEGKAPKLHTVVK